MKFSEALGLCRGITAVIGSGGKSSLLNTLATELRDRGTVVLCTTTHMFPPEHMCTLQRADAETVTRALSRDGAVCAGELACDGRLHSPLSADFGACVAGGLCASGGRRLEGPAR